jgi:trehalose-6-phosphatase
MQSNKKYIVSDLDGTLVRILARKEYSTYINSKEKKKINFGRFFNPEVILSMDVARVEVIQKLKDLKAAHPDAHLVLSSGRSAGTDMKYDPAKIANLTGNTGAYAIYEDAKTVNKVSILDFFFIKHNLVFDKVLMRPHGCNMDDAKLKLQWLNEELGGAENVIAWIDDRPKVVEALKGAGVNVDDVNEHLESDFY